MAEIKEIAVFPDFWIKDLSGQAMNETFPATVPNSKQVFKSCI